MAIKHTWITTIKNDAGANVISDSEVLTAAAEENFEMALPGSNTTDEVDIAVDVSQIISFFVESSVDVSMKTYSGVTLKQTIPLSAKKAYSWNANDTVHTCPLTDDLTKITFTNTGTVAAAIVGGFLLDI